MQHRAIAIERVRVRSNARPGWRRSRSPAATAGWAQLQQQLAAAEAELERAVIRAPVAGTVLTRKVEPGDGVRPGQVLLEIAADAPGELLLPVDEKLVGRLRVGQPAIGIAEAYPDRPFSAQVYRIAPVVDPARGSVDVRLRLGADADFLRQDMTATATIRTGERTQALVVPNDALLDRSDGSQRASALVVRDGRVRRVAGDTRTARHHR